MKFIKVIIITCAIIIVTFFSVNHVKAFELVNSMSFTDQSYIDARNSFDSFVVDSGSYSPIEKDGYVLVGVYNSSYCYLPDGTYVMTDRNGFIRFSSPDGYLIDIYLYYRNGLFSMYDRNSNVQLTRVADISALVASDPDFEIDAGYTGIPISVDSEAFTQWLLETEKYKELPGTFEKAYIKGLTNVFVYNGLSTIPFFNALNSYLHILDKPNVPQIFSEELRDKYYSLLQEYKVAHIETIYPNHNHPHNRVNIETQTNDDNTTLITDSPDDTIDTSILRDILRAIISMNTNISYQCDILKMRLDNIFYDCNQILDKLDFLGGGSDQNVDLAELWIYNPSEVATIQQDFNMHLQDEIDSKTLLADNLNNKPYMPEKLLSQQDSVTLTMQLPGTLSVDNEMSGYTITSSEYSVSSADFPKLDNFIKKFRTFAGVLMVVGYAVHMRFRIAALIRGEA